MKRSHKRLFWIVIALILLISAGRILSWPTQSDGRDPDPLVISEFLANNNTGLQDENGDYVDWIEIHNRSVRDVRLLGWALSDDPDRPDKWVFSDTTIPAHERMVLFASGKDRREGGTDTHLHTNFRLNGAGGITHALHPTSRRFIDPNPSTIPLNSLMFLWALWGKWRGLLF